MGYSRAETIYTDFSKDAPVRYGALYNVPIHKIRPNPANPRKNFDPGALEELAQSIREVGVLQPLVLVWNDDGETFRIVAGERRWRAAEMAGVASVPALIAQLTPAQEAEIMLIENLQREDLGPIEEAQAYRRLLDECGYTQEALAEKIGVSQPHIANRLRLLKLPEAVQEKISRGIISAGHGRELASFKIPAPVLEKAVEKLVEDNIPVARVAESVKVFVAGKGMPLFPYWRDTPEFKTKECESCANRVLGKEYEGSSKEKPFCLNEACWRRKQDEARRAKTEKLQKKAEREGYIDLSKLVYGSHFYYWREADEYNRYDQTECFDCEKRKLGKRRPDEEAELICTDPKCMDKKRAEYQREQKKREKEAFAAEIERIEQLAEEIAGGYFENSEDEFRALLTKRQLVHLASLFLLHFDALPTRTSCYKYLKKRFGWDEPWLKNAGWWSRSRHYDDLIEKLSGLPPIQLLELLFAWPAIARGLDGPEGWLLREVGGHADPGKD